MTATHETLARPASFGNAATAIFALLGLIDVALTAVIGSADALPPGFLRGYRTHGHERGRAHSMIVSPNAHWCFRPPGEATP
jgi:hypothetical protein